MPMDNTCKTERPTYWIPNKGTLMSRLNLTALWITVRPAVPYLWHIVVFIPLFTALVAEGSKTVHLPLIANVILAGLLAGVITAGSVLLQYSLVCAFRAVQQQYQDNCQRIERQHRQEWSSGMWEIFFLERLEKYFFSRGGGVGYINANKNNNLAKLNDLSSFSSFFFFSF